MPLNQPSPAAVCEGGTEGQVVAGEDMSKKIWKPYVISKSRESCTELEHEKFLEALHLFDLDSFDDSRLVLNSSLHCSRSAEEEAARRRRGRYRYWWLEYQQSALLGWAVLESKPQLVEIRDRVRSDVGGTLAAPSAQHQKGPVSPIQSEGKRVATAANPNPEDAADLLRMCLQCGIPKTFTTGKGMVYPVCNDRPPANPNKEAEKKKGSTIKDKEKNKRMKGHSSHASWKSETEMQLRQQFD
ncbi:unnamed protein product [Rhodiola kirilowii]